MEGEWRFVNRHRDPADGEVAGLQVSRLVVPGRAASRGETGLRAQAALHSSSALGLVSGPQPLVQ